MDALRVRRAAPAILSRAVPSCTPRLLKWDVLQVMQVNCCRRRVGVQRELQIKGSAQKVQQVLGQFGLATTVREMPASTRTAKDAAQVIGCSAGQIAKSLVFRGANSGRAILIIASGTNRVDERAMASVVGEPIERASPDFVRAATGYAIGGIPPVGHNQQLPVWMDQALFSFERIWAAAGTPESVFEIRPDDLARITKATVIEL
jgi:prolyl-tRNA editing enzyme YbaK/EbsC (Cys-tRNA(Pro) deacylase)